MKVLETERLILRTWRQEDVNMYFQINQDPKVFEYTEGSLTLQQIQGFISIANNHMEKYGYAQWTVELKKTEKLIGYIGIYNIDWKDISFTPAVTIGWRLGSQYWGKGYATEGAKAALDYGFNHCGIEEIISTTVPMNKASVCVMEKIGMQRDLSNDFAHPLLPLDHRTI